MPAPTFISSAGPNSFTTSTAGLNYPATRAAGDWDILGIIYEGPASNVASISGWGTKILSAAGGSMFIDVYAKQADGTETGSVGTITVTGGTSSQAACATYRSSTGTLVVGATTSGADTTSGTAYSATTASITTVANDLIVYILGQNGVGTHTSRTLTQAGATLGTLTNRFNAAGASVRQEFGDRPVTTGATAAIIHGCTLSVAATGITGIVLLSEGAAAATGTVAATQAADTAAATGTLGYGGTVFGIQAADTAAAVGNLSYIGTVAVAQAAHTLDADGLLIYSSSGATAQAGDSVTAAGVVADASVAGSAAVAQDSQVPTATGVLNYSATASPAQAPDQAVAAGLLHYSASGTALQEGDSLAADGITFVPAVGTVAVTQESQTSSAQGVSLGDIVFRPDLGETPRPAAGSAARPFAGTTPRP